jgi:hypothetical protein
MAQRVDTEPRPPPGRPWWLALGSLLLLGCPIADLTTGPDGGRADGGREQETGLPAPDTGLDVALSDRVVADAPTDAPGDAPDSSGRDTGGVTDGSAPGNFYVYQNGLLSHDWQTNVSFGSPPPVVNLTDTTHPQAPAHTYDLSVVSQLDGGGNNFGAWQPAATNYRSMPLGWDGTPYSYMTLDLYPTGGDVYDMDWHYFADIAGATPDLAASAYISDLSDWVGSLVGGQWNRGLKIPLAAVGQLGNANVEQFFLRDDTNSANTYYVDNVGFVPGSYAWAYSGGVGPAAGWADAGTDGGATANYAYLPTDHDPSLISLNGTKTPGTSGASTNVVELSVTSPGGMLKLVNAGGFDTSAYQYLTFGAVPTKSGYSYNVQLYDTNNAPIGMLLKPVSGHDWGTSSPLHWTVYCIPLTGFGTIGTIGGLSIQDASGATTNTIYLSAIGFYR